MNLDLRAYGLTRLGHCNEKLRCVSGISTLYLQAWAWFYFKKNKLKTKKLATHHPLR
jgi:hypothetical protein